MEARACWTAWACWAIAVGLCLVPDTHTSFTLIPVAVVFVGLATTMTVRRWMKALAMPVDAAWELGYRQGVKDGADLGRNCPNIIDLQSARIPAPAPGGPPGPGGSPPNGTRRLSSMN